MLNIYRKFTDELQALEVIKRIEDPKFSYRAMFITKPQLNGKQLLCFSVGISALNKAEITEAFMKHHPDAISIK